MFDPNPKGEHLKFIELGSSPMGRWGGKGLIGVDSSLKFEPAPKSRKRRIATKSPKHQVSQNIVYQYIKIDVPIAIGIVFSWLGGKKISFRSGLKFKVSGLCDITK
jgi:hypothetical protein